MNNEHHHQQGDEDKENNKPLSPWLIGSFMLALLWGGLYLGFNSGGFRQDVYDSDAVNWAGGGAVNAPPPDPKVVGKRLFSQNCLVCHQANGQGISGQFPPLVGSEWVNSDATHGENHLVMLILHGHQGPMKVMGASYNNAMPQWKQLSNEQIAAILTYIRSDWGNNSPAVSPDYVAKIRKESDAQSDPCTEQQLMAMPPAKKGDSSATPPSK